MINETVIELTGFISKLSNLINKSNKNIVILLV